MSQSMWFLCSACNFGASTLDVFATHQCNTGEDNDEETVIKIEDAGAHSSQQVVAVEPGQTMTLAALPDNLLSPSSSGAGALWTNEEMGHLVESYSKYYYMTLNRNVKKKRVWMLISKNMATLGSPNISYIKAESKWKSMTARFRESIRHNSLHPNAPKKCAFFAEISQLYEYTIADDNDDEDAVEAMDQEEADSVEDAKEQAIAMDTSVSQKEIEDIEDSGSETTTAISWSNGDTSHLLEQMKQYQGLFRDKNVKKRSVWKLISKKMEETNPEKFPSAAQCENKFKGLNVHFRKAREYNRLNPDNPHMMKFYNEIHAFHDGMVETVSTDHDETNDSIIEELNKVNDMPSWTPEQVLRLVSAYKKHWNKLQEGKQSAQQAWSLIAEDTKQDTDKHSFTQLHCKRKLEKVWEAFLMGEDMDGDVKDAMQALKDLDAITPELLEADSKVTGEQEEDSTFYWNNFLTQRFLQNYRLCHNLQFQDHPIKRRSMWKLIAKKMAAQATHKRECPSWQVCENKWKRLLVIFRKTERLNAENKFGRKKTCPFHNDISELSKSTLEVKKRAGIGSKAVRNDEEDDEEDEDGNDNDDEDIAEIEKELASPSEKADTSPQSSVRISSRIQARKGRAALKTSSAAISTLTPKAKSLKRAGSLLHSGSPSTHNGVSLLHTSDSPKVQATKTKVARSLSKTTDVTLESSADEICQLLRMINSEQKMHNERMLNQMKSMHKEEMKVLGELIDIVKQSKQ